MTSLLIAIKIIPMIFMALFPVVNPIGTALILYGMTRGIDDQTWKLMSTKIAFYSFLFLSFFFFFRQLHSEAFRNIHPGRSIFGRSRFGIDGLAAFESKRDQ
jgi:small neutral amino acid transporter SnatA (MarC family)